MTFDRAMQLTAALTAGNLRIFDGTNVHPWQSTTSVVGNVITTQQQIGSANGAAAHGEYNASPAVIAGADGEIWPANANFPVTII